jgi:hypothetical protein
MLLIAFAASGHATLFLIADNSRWSLHLAAAKGKVLCIEPYIPGHADALRSTELRAPSAVPLSLS